MKIAIHGFNVTDPEETIGKLAKMIENCVLFTYGWKGLLGVIFTNKKEATKLKNLVESGKGYGAGKVNIVAHSNGNAIAVEAARQGLEIDHLVCIAPALKRNLVFPKNIKRVTVFYTKHDVPTKAAAFLDMVPFVQLLIPNAWGKMGAKGALNNIEADGTLFDSRVTNYRNNSVKGHSDWFSEKHIKETALLVSRLTS